MTAAILRQICDLGYVVVVHVEAGALHLAAQREGVPRETHVARVDRSGEFGFYVAACTLAASVGIDLEDG